MIVDCYTHCWESDEQLGRAALPPASSSDGEASPTANARRHIDAAEPIDVTFVIGFRSQYLDAHIPNEQIAAYVNQHPGKLIGFAGIDPSDPDQAIEEIRRTQLQLSMRGVAVAPGAQDFHPTDSRAMRVYAEAASLGLPIIFHTGPQMTKTVKLEYTRPVLIDEIARDLPNLKILIAHLGSPWIHETLALLAKHDNVFAETSWLLHQPWEAYLALIRAHQLDVIDKILFGSGFPTATAAEAIEELYGLSHFAQGSNLPTIPREKLRGIVERDALALLGLSPKVGLPPQAVASSSNAAPTTGSSTAQTATGPEASAAN